MLPVLPSCQNFARHLGEDGIGVARSMKRLCNGALRAGEIDEEDAVTLLRK